MKAITYIRETAFALAGSFAICFTYASWHEKLSAYDFLLAGVQEKGLLILAAFILLETWYVKQYAVSRNGAVRRVPGKVFIIESILAGLFAVMLVLGRAFSADYSIQPIPGIYGSVSTIFGSLGRILISAVVFAGLFVVLLRGIRKLYDSIPRLKQLLDKAPGGKTKATLKLHEALRSNSRKSVALLMLALLVCWAPYLVVFFPGCIHHDGAYQILQFYGQAQWSTHHPLLPGLLMGFCINVGRVFGSDTAGVFFYVCLQSVYLSFACASICKTASSLARSSWLGVVAMVFFAIVPLFAGNVVSVKKDALFFASFGLLASSLFSQLIRDADNSKWEDKPLLVLYALLAALTRNEGVLLACAALIAFAIVELSGNGKRQCAFKMAAVAVVLVVYAVGYQGFLVGYLNAQSGSIGEALTIPIQQVARCYSLHADDVPEEIDAKVGELLTTSGLTAENYYPLLSDNIKFNYFHKEYTNSDVLEFFAGYLELGAQYPKDYFDASVDQTIGWWYPELYGDADHAVCGMGIIQLTPKQDLYEQVVDVDMLFNDDFRERATMVIAAFAYIPGIGLLMYPPVYLWMYVLLFGFTLCQGRKKAAVLFIPVILGFAICMASPASGLTRYAIPLIMLLPLYAGLTLGFHGSSGSRGNAGLAAGGQEIASSAPAD